MVCVFCIHKGICYLLTVAIEVTRFGSLNQNVLIQVFLLNGG